MSAETLTQCADGTKGSPDSSGTGNNQPDPTHAASSNSAAEPNGDEIGKLVQSLVEQNKTLAKRLDDQSRVIGAMQKRGEPEQPKKASTGNTELDALREQVDEMRREGEAMKARAAAQTSAAQRMQMRDALVAKGIDPSLADLVVDAQRAQQGGRFRTELGDTGGYETVYREADEAQPVTLSEWAEVFSATDIGQRLIPALRTPGKAPSANPTHQLGRKIRVSREEARKLTAEQKLSGNYEYAND